MRRVMTILATVLTFMLPAVAFPSTWDIDPDHSSVSFKVRHLMVSNVKGVFGKVQGVVHVDETDVTKSTAAATIQADSINTGLAMRDKDLRGPKFLDVAKYPAMTFVSSSVTRSSTGKLKVTGDLNLHGVTRPVVLDVEGPTAEVKDPKGNIRRGASATTRINRKDFGLTWNKAMEAGGVMVGEDIDISIEVELVKAADK